MTKNETYLVTPSLLNSWLYIYEVEDEYVEKAYQDFITTLKREPTEPNEFMLRGIEFEDECVRGENPDISPIIKDGCFQVVCKKEINVGGFNFLMYGRMDVVKDGVIYDIKRVSKYERPKYNWSCQHQFYLELVPMAKHFEYLIHTGKAFYKEKYQYDNERTIPNIIMFFINFLKQRNLLNIYLEKWRSK